MTTKKKKMHVAKQVKQAESWVRLLKRRQLLISVNIYHTSNNQTRLLYISVNTIIKANTQLSPDHSGKCDSERAAWYAGCTIK
jgi:hypothetical protein